MSVSRQLARLLLLIALLHLPLIGHVAGPFGMAPAWADDDGGDDGDGGDGGNDGGDDDGGNDDSGDDDGEHGSDESHGDDAGRSGSGGGPGGSFERNYHDDDDDDAEHARRARLKGTLLPLSEVMRAARRAVPGKVLSVRLRRAGGRYYYHFRILDRRNHVRSLRLPASGRLRTRNWNSGR